MKVSVLFAGRIFVTVLFVSKNKNRAENICRALVSDTVVALFTSRGLPRDLIMKFFFMKKILSLLFSVGDP